jgi:hypothetical protein
MWENEDNPVEPVLFDDVEVRNRYGEISRVCRYFLK